MIGDNIILRNLEVLFETGIISEEQCRAALRKDWELSYTFPQPREDGWSERFGAILDDERENGRIG